ncbi:MAG: hypothetical protein EBZ61_10450 [Micrococcales bacterium]|nr:hypothetical protein [Micrococcales bacterium]
MALDYKNWKYGDRLISADTDTVERAIVDGIVKPQAPSADDLRWALEWLAIYASDENVELAQAFANCIAFQLGKSQKRIRKGSRNSCFKSESKEEFLTLVVIYSDCS